MDVDDTVCLDDLLCARLTQCTRCGTRPHVLDQVRMRIGPLTLACVQCLKCRNADPETRDLHAHLVERYRDAKEYG
jgi:hypothetical protein